MSAGFVAAVLEQMTPSIQRRFAGIRLDLDAATVSVLLTNGQSNTYTLAQAVAWLAARTEPLIVTEAELIAMFDDELKWWIKEDGTPPPEGGWPEGQKPGRGGRR